MAAGTDNIIEITSLGPMNNPYIDKFNDIASSYYNRIAAENKIHFVNTNPSFDLIQQLASQASENNHLVGLGWMTHLEGIDLYIIDKQQCHTSNSAH